MKRAARSRDTLIQALMPLFAIGLISCQQTSLGGGSQAPHDDQAAEDSGAADDSAGGDAKDASKAGSAKSASSAGKSVAAKNDSTTSQRIAALNDLPAPAQSDIDQLVAKDPGGPGVIYVVISHLVKGKGTANLDTVRFGLAKALNSVSTNPSIVVPVPLDKAETLYRVDLNAYNQADKWQYIKSKNSGSSQSVRSVSGKEVVDGDWLVYALTRPETYDGLMNLPQLVGGLDATLGVNYDNAVFINSEQSNITFNKRILMRIPTNWKGQTDGYYWRSYDFAIGGFAAASYNDPASLAQSLRGGGTLTNIPRLVAGEFFFSLPNGLQGYMLSGFGGQHRIDAQSIVATDRNRPDDGLSRCSGGASSCGYVINGESCIVCHSSGINRPVVQGAVFKGSTRLNDEEGKALADKLFNGDSARFTKALLKIRADMHLGETPNEPVKEAVSRYKEFRKVDDRRQQGPEVAPVF